MKAIYQHSSVSCGVDYLDDIATILNDLLKLIFVPVPMVRVALDDELPYHLRAVSYSFEGA
jgi:hypothetical protein